MKKQLLLLLALSLSLAGYSQIIFEKGYYIDNANQKTDCQIKNIDWKNSPTEFNYKLKEDTEAQTLNTKSVKEFGIYTKSKYIRYNGNIDVSSDNLERLSDSKDPVFESQTLFLKVLQEGKANLYLYDIEGMRRFFYSVDNSEVKQLIFKIYRDKDYTSRKNDEFKKQLWNDLKCIDTPVNEFENLEYNKSDLASFFEKYNKCNNSEIVDFDKKIKRDWIDLTLRPGINISSLSTQSKNVALIPVDFDSELTFRFGVEAEFILPFNKNKWSFLIEPTYQYYKSEKVVILRPGTIVETKEKYNADYKSIELPIGIRHYFFLNNNSKLFVNGLFVVDFLIGKPNSIKTESVYVRDLNIKTTPNLAFGLGYKYHNKYNLELRYQNRNLLNGYSEWNSDYSSLSVIFGFTIF
jgi:hypothetical protein